MGYHRKQQYEFIILFLSLVTCAASVETGQKNVLCEYNRTKALILVEYASAVYTIDDESLLSWSCSRCEGLTKGFKIHTLVIDSHCLQAFVGVAENLKSIVIAFRGTQDTSMQNWAEDLYFRELDLNYPGYSDALVHSGFYAAYHNTTLRERIVNAVQEIVQTRSDLSIMVTGHSMGGAMATFCGFDLSANYGFKNVEVTTFGQPRVGNYAFAMCYNEFVPLTIRVTHANDLVPHVPPNYPWLGEKTYHHFATEVGYMLKQQLDWLWSFLECCNYARGFCLLVWIFRIAIGRLQYEFERVCDGSGEDNSCSRSVTGNSIADHLSYYGVSLRSEDDLFALQSSLPVSNLSHLGWGCKTSVQSQRL